MKWLITFVIFVNFSKILDSNNTDLSNTELCTRDEDCRADWTCIQKPTGICFCSSQARLSDSYCQGIVLSEEINNKLPPLRRSRRQGFYIQFEGLGLLVLIIVIVCIIGCCVGLCCYVARRNQNRVYEPPPAY